MKVDLDDMLCVVLVKRKVDPLTDKDAVVILTPANAQDAMRINAALRQAQNMLLELTKRALQNGQKQAERLK